MSLIQVCAPLTLQLNPATLTCAFGTTSAKPLTSLMTLYCRVCAPDHAPPHFEEAFDDWFLKFPSHSRLAPLPHWIFIGPAGTRTPLHLDPYGTHAWFVQVLGRKRFKLYPPCALPLICNGSRFAACDDQDFPSFSSTPHYEATVCPGDLLFVRKCTPSPWH